ncbi:sensor histidine kinase [Polyangium jinanense]|uniref:Sensor histidine kinase n=1 Tax=Polyangium jinanense TaxID=2829994 RepID=A0A9X4AR56_9BACT|nr:sensor histidine kinase [Polyangium jinanense]MDC3955457.1 sensor histidine kinase [Polyangium jinanense]MDC3981758.1 sensor histidine kinase [Polyangium jinanense]
MTFGTGARERRYDAPRMDRPPPTRMLLFVAGTLAWAAIAQPFLLPLVRDPARLLDSTAAVSFAAHAAYLGAFLASASRLDRLGPRSRIVLLVVQSISALVLVHLRNLWLEAGLLAIVAAQASLLLSRGAALGWVAAQTVAIFPFYVGRADVAQAAFWTAGVLGFQLFATTIGTVARHEAVARAELSRVNAELRAAQVMLAESARTAERLHIARELHDAVGHHLTAMSIHLELARRTSPGEETLARAHELAKSTLSEVRGVVRAMREERTLDLPRAIEALAAGLPRPRVHVDLAEGLVVEDDALAHALFRGVQEAITNAARHGGAENLWIRLAEEPEGVVLEARDDGRGATSATEGSGLLGLRERIEALGGVLTVTPGPGKGFEWRAVVPPRQRTMTAP